MRIEKSPSNEGRGAIGLGCREPIDLRRSSTLPAVGCDFFPRWVVSLLQARSSLEGGTVEILRKIQQFEYTDFVEY